jgi:hypothetical protein
MFDDVTAKLLASVLLLACGPRSGSADEAGGAGASITETDSDGESATSSGEPDYEPESCEPSFFDECRGPEYDDYWFICDPDFVPPDDVVHPDNGCRNLMCDASHCGECGRKCPFAQCVEGKCTGGGSPCVTPDDAIEHDLKTCAQVCAHFGHQCEDRLKSESGHLGCDRGYGYSLADPWTGEPSCRRGTSGSRFQEAHCDDEIRWDHGTDEQPQTGISCCCKGDY